MKRISLSLCLLLSCFAAWFMHAADAQTSCIYTIDTIREIAALFEITPQSIKIIPSKIEFKDTNVGQNKIEVYTENQVINTINGPVTVPPSARASTTPRVDGLVWANNPTAAACDTSIKLYHNNNVIRLCNCSFWITMSMAVEDKNTIGYHHTLCSHKLTLEQKAPLSVKGIEKAPFCNLTALTIRGCAKLSGTGGALNNILAVMKNLTELTINDTQLDETVVDAEHDALEILDLRRCNCTDVRRVVMPKLRLLILDHNPLPPILYSLIKVPESCVKSFTSKV